MFRLFRLFPLSRGRAGDVPFGYGALLVIAPERSGIESWVANSVF